MMNNQYLDLIYSMIWYLNTETVSYYQLRFLHKRVFCPLAISKMDFDGTCIDQEFSDYTTAIKWLSLEINKSMANGT